MSTVYITLDQIRAAGACFEYQKSFKRAFGSRVAITRANVLKYLAKPRTRFYGRATWLKYALLTEENQNEMDLLVTRLRQKDHYNISWQFIFECRALAFWKIYRKQQLALRPKAKKKRKRS